MFIKKKKNLMLTNPQVQYFNNKNQLFTKNHF